jgi:hypothetical protein
MTQYTQRSNITWNVIRRQKHSEIGTDNFGSLDIEMVTVNMDKVINLLVSNFLSNFSMCVVFQEMNVIQFFGIVLNI